MASARVRNDLIAISPELGTDIFTQELPAVGSDLADSSAVLNGLNLPGESACESKFTPTRHYVASALPGSMHALQISVLVRPHNESQLGSSPGGARTARTSLEFVTKINRRRKDLSEASN